MNKLTLVTIFALGITTLPLSSFAKEVLQSSSELTSVKQLTTTAIELREKLNQYQQFSANFHQTVIDNKGREIQQATGFMKMKQPNQFNWVTNEPDESVVVSDGTSVWIYNPFVEQVTAVSLNSTMAQSPLWLIANQSDDAWSEFTVEKVASKTTDAPLNQQRYIVTPKDKKNITRKVTMTFNQAVIDHLMIEDTQGQISTFTFSDFDSASSIEDSYFKFELPADVDFDDQREVR